MKQEIQRAIYLGNLAKAFKVLKKITDSKVRNDVILLSARFENLNQKSRMGVESQTTLRIERNKIAQAILSLVDDLPANDTPYQVEPQKYTPMNFKKEKIRLIKFKTLFKDSGTLQEIVGRALPALKTYKTAFNAEESDEYRYNLNAAQKAWEAVEGEINAFNPVQKAKGMLINLLDLVVSNSRIDPGDISKMQNLAKLAGIRFPELSAEDNESALMILLNFYEEIV